MSPILTGTIRECERCRMKTGEHEYEVLAAIDDEMIRDYPYLSVGKHYFCDNCIEIVTGGRGLPED